jgi:hypothetical protein
MEFEAKFRLNSPNLGGVVKQVDALGIGGRRKAEILHQCASVIFAAETFDKPHFRKRMFRFAFFFVCVLFFLRDVSYG